MAYIKKVKLLFIVLQTLFIISRSFAKLSQKVKFCLYLRERFKSSLQQGVRLNSLKKMRLIARKKTPTKIHICTTTFSVFA